MASVIVRRLLSQAAKEIPEVDAPHKAPAPHLHRPQPLAASLRQSMAPPASRLHESGQRINLAVADRPELYGHILFLSHQYPRDRVVLSRGAITVGWLQDMRKKKTATDHPVTVQKQHKQIIRKSEAIPVYVGVLKPEGGFKLTPKPFGPTIATVLYSWLWPSFGIQAG